VYINLINFNLQGGDVMQAQTISADETYIETIFKRALYAIKADDGEQVYEVLSEGSTKLDQDMLVSMFLKSTNDALELNKSNIVELIMSNITTFYARRFHHKVENAANQNHSSACIAQNDNVFEVLKAEYSHSARNIKTAIAEQIFSKLLTRATDEKISFSNKMVQAVVKHVESPNFIQHHLKALSTNENREVENIFDLLGLKMGAIFAVSNPQITRIH